MIGLRQLAEHLTGRWLANQLRKASDRWIQVLSINDRNLNYIYPNNDRCDYPLADNKLKTKEVLLAHGVPFPQTYATYSYFYDLGNLAQDLSAHDEFVIKPASGRGGGGIIVIAGRQGEHWRSVGGTIYTLDDIRKHISDIIFGVYSFDLHDQAIVEARLEQHQDIEPLSPYGLADVRVVVCEYQPVMSMIRLATKASNGTANLHQGAVGVGIDMDTGKTRHAIFNGESISHHPDSGVELIGCQLPYWQNILEVARTVSKAVPLKYLGIDVAVEASGPKILEINVRPGIEIQNANLIGMRGVLESLGMEGVEGMALVTGTNSEEVSRE